MYSARQVRVSVGCRTVGWDADGWSPDPSPAALHAGETEWLWTSRVMDMHQAGSPHPTAPSRKGRPQGSSGWERRSAHVCPSLSGGRRRTCRHTQVDTMQRFKLPRPVVCAGGLLRVELLGRAQMQARTHPHCEGRLSENVRRPRRLDSGITQQHSHPNLS